MLKALLALAMAATTMPAHAAPPSVPEADAPELARLGSSGVGFRTLTLTHRAQPDFDSANVRTGTVPIRDRALIVDLWYPAQMLRGARTTTYRAAFWGEPPHPPVAFTVNGIAVANATPTGAHHPLVIVSHGYSNAPAAMTWLTENLASKGYVVAAIHHDDPNPYVTTPERRAAPNFNRPQDIAFVTARLRATLGAQIDPARVALIGYSQGGYGVLTAGGARLAPDHPNMALVAGRWLKTIARGTPGADRIVVPDVRAIIALAPGGGGSQSVWGTDGLMGIRAPLLLIAGDADPVVGYNLGAKAFFAAAANSDRYLLTFKQAGHSIGLNPVPPAMRGTLWDRDWFEDPIWRAARVNAISLHFITAFLALHLRNDGTMRPYLDVPATDSDAGDWKAPETTPWGGYSPGGNGVTLWKGFQRRHARGLTMQHLPPMR